MRFFVVVQGDEIIVTSPTGFRAAYFKRPYHPQLVLRRRTQTDDQELLARAWAPYRHPKLHAVAVAEEPERPKNLINPFQHRTVEILERFGAKPK